MDVKINIKTTQCDNNGNIDTMISEFCGKMYEKNNDIYVVYKEEEDGTTSTIKISNDQISIKRFGTVNSNMIFKNKEKNTTKYRIPQGLFLIDTYTNDLDIDICKNKSIKINIDYNIRIEGMFEGKNKIEISIK